MTAKPSVFPSVGRLLVYGVLVLATAFFLLPLYAMLVTAFKDAEEIRSTSLLALPGSLNWSAWGTAWSTACTGVDCNGLRPFFWNSVAMTVPAVLISTVWGALNGYVLSLWKFRGSDTLFGLLLFGVFMPFQVVLLPMSQVLGWLGLSSSITGLVLVHCLAGLAGTTLDLDVAREAELFDVARSAWAEAGKPKPHLATSFWFALGDPEEARAQVHRHLLRYMNWIPSEFVDAMAPTTGWAGTDEDLAAALRRFADIGADEVHLIPTSADVDQVRRVADVVADVTGDLA